MIYATLFGESPRGAAPPHKGDAQEAKILQGLVASVLKSPPAAQ